MSEQPTGVPPQDLWTRLFRIAMRILQFGALLGVLAYLFLGREFRNDELGVLVWPLTALYVLSFFYVLTFLVFTSVKSWLRYIVIPLWLLMMLLMAGALASLAFTKKERDVEPGAPPNGGPATQVANSPIAEGRHR